jgi:cell division protein FtsI/penicillin-binding protein 2
MGHYAPGSTFKVSTSLALIRAGMTPDSTIECPANVKVGNTSYGNVSGFGHTGTLTLREAVAYSCNTAMINGTLNLPGQAISDAAASLGLGLDYKRGFPSFYGSVPASDDPAMKASNSFGQGEISVSPMAMAGEAASVGAGKTIIPYLLSEPVVGAPAADPDPSVAPLTETEVGYLRDEMAAVVNIGTGSSLKGLVNGAKSGTAEFTTADGTLAEHGWMIAFTDTYAIAAFVDVASNGSGAAAPLIQQFLV